MNDVLAVLVGGVVGGLVGVGITQAIIYLFERRKGKTE
jgi:formate/nitrite transporter FocA (FNT family)